MQPAINAAIVEAVLQYCCLQQDRGHGSVYRAKFPCKNDDVQ